MALDWQLFSSRLFLVTADHHLLLLGLCRQGQELFQDLIQISPTASSVHGAVRVGLSDRIAIATIVSSRRSRKRAHIGGIQVCPTCPLVHSLSCHHDIHFESVVCVGKLAVLFSLCLRICVLCVDAHLRLLTSPEKKTHPYQRHTESHSAD